MTGGGDGTIAAGDGRNCTAPGTDGVWFTDDDVQSSYGANEIIYCGYRYDPETQNYYVRNRYYSPVLGRWITRDLVGHAGGINLYGYVESAPVGKADSHGQDSWGFGISAFVGYNFSDPPGASSNQYREGFGFKATLALNGLWDPVKGRMSLNADASLWGRVSMGWGWFQFSTGFYLNHEIRLASLPAPSPLSASGG